MSRSNSSGVLTSSQSFVAGHVDLLKSRQSINRSHSLPQLLPTFFVDLEDTCLHLYGEGSLEELDQPHSQGTSVQEIQFHYIEFEEIAPLLSKISRAFPLVRVSNVSI